MSESNGFSRGYDMRAEECIRLASVTEDNILRRELLTLRQTYLRIASRLMVVEQSESAGSDAKAI